MPPKKSIFKRWWFYLIILLLLLVAFGYTKDYFDNQKRNKESANNGPNQKEALFEWPSATAKTITAVPVDLTQIEAISKYRSCAGHDRAGYNFVKVLESDRSMKHYFYPTSEAFADKIKVFAPFDGKVVMIQHIGEDADGTPLTVQSSHLMKDGTEDIGEVQKWQNTTTRKKIGDDVDLVSPLDENAVFGFRHINFIRPLNLGEAVKAGELLGYAAVNDRGSDFDIDYVAREYKREGDKYVEVLDSAFDHMTPQVLAEFAKYGVTPENTKFSKEERDAKPCGYDPVTKYGQDFCYEGWDNECWVKLSH